MIFFQKHPSSKTKVQYVHELDITILAYQHVAMITEYIGIAVIIHIHDHYDRRKKK